MIGTALERLAGLPISLSERLISPNIVEDILAGAGTDGAGVNAGTDGLKAEAFGLNDVPLEKLKLLLGMVVLFIAAGVNTGALTLELKTGTVAARLKMGASTAGLNTGASGLKTGASGLNTGASGLNTEASGLNTGAEALKLDMPSILAWPLRGAEVGPEEGIAGENEKLEENEAGSGLNVAEGLYLNSLASTLNFVVEDRDVCLLCIADPVPGNANFGSFHELLTWDAVLECCAEPFAPLWSCSSSRLGFVASETVVLAPSLSARGFSACCPPKPNGIGC